MLKVGLTGGMACGKSFVAGVLRNLGCYVIEADEIARDAISPGGEAYDAVVAAFGPGILGPQGQIDRLRLADLVFVAPAQLDRLNAIIHPVVRARALREFQQIAERDPRAIVIYVAAILIESGAWKEVDKIIVVRCAREQQMERALRRPGASEASVLARLERQMPLEEKTKFADYIIHASGTQEDTVRQTESVYEKLRSLA